jgi:hypothetical protein
MRSSHFQLTPSPPSHHVALHALHPVHFTKIRMNCTKTAMHVVLHLLIRLTFDERILLDSIRSLPLNSDEQLCMSNSFAETEIAFSNTPGTIYILDKRPYVQRNSTQVKESAGQYRI